MEANKTRPRGECIEFFIRDEPSSKIMYKTKIKDIANMVKDENEMRLSLGTFSLEIETLVLHWFQNCKKRINIL